jgi:hypothetical protein
MSRGEEQKKARRRGKKGAKMENEEKRDQGIGGGGERK